MRIKVLLTFDYELPLGSVQSYDKGLFEPASKLLECVNQLNEPIILFADICSAIQFQKWDNIFYKSFKDQIQTAIKRNHDVQLHIHPHWLESSFEAGRFIPSPKYGLSDFTGNEHLTIEKIIEDSYSALNEMCLEADEKYKCIAFRAGGYNVEPESRRILSKLYDLGIRFESSVIPGLYQNLPFSKIDYRKTPRKNSWPISKDGPLTIEKSSELIEYPITSMPIPANYLLQRPIQKILNKNELKSRLYNNTGQGYRFLSAKQNWLDKVRTVFNPLVFTFDREHITWKNLKDIIEWNIQRFHDEDELYLTSISHPKSMGSYHIGLMKECILRMKETYDASFITYKDISLKK